MKLMRMWVVWRSVYDSGLMRIETSFMTGDTEFNKSIVRIFYV